MRQSRRLFGRRAAVMRGRDARPPGRPWSVTANATLLALQALGFAALAALYLGPLGDEWPLTPEVLDAGRIAILTGIGFGLLAVVALIASFGLLRRARGAWVMAVMAQGINLLAALVLYYSGRPAYVYAMMVYGILMVLYLHQADVQAAFNPPAESAEEEHLP